MNQTSQQPSLKEKQSHGTRLFPCAYYGIFAKIK